MKKTGLEHLSPLERRQFLQWLGGAVALPLLPRQSRETLFELIFGNQAMAQSLNPTLFVEINFRDQWDFGHLFVPPSVARNYDSIRSRIALFDQPIAERNNFYVTPQAQELRPHLDNIAVMELGELTLPDGLSVHGHEAGNPLRSPGRSQTAGAGRIDMATVDKRPGVSGNEILYSSSPTPLILHNYYQKSLSPGLPNGVLMRSSIRERTHTYYHFEAGLPNAQVTRFFDRASLLQSYGSSSTTPPPTTTARKFSSMLSDLLKRADDRYLTRSLASATVKNQHQAKTGGLATELMPSASSGAGIELSSAETSYWKSGIPDQLDCPGDNADQCFSVTGRWHVGEVFGYAFKLLANDRARSVGIDFDMHDVHTNRTPFVMRTMAQQSGITLARFIESLKLAGLWERTVIAMYTIDGSRSPLLNSTGDGTKNAVILAGGGIRGGYYGDISVNPSNGTVTYFRPDDNGVPVSSGTTTRGSRVPAADVYKTVAKAAGITDNVVSGFADIAPGKVLSYMLK